MKTDIVQKYEKFALQLRTEMKWDKELFDDLFIEMKAYCNLVADSNTIDRNIAGVFWNASWWVKSQIKDIEAFQSEYYVNAITNLDHLAWWLFEEEAREDSEFEPIA